MTASNRLTRHACLVSVVLVTAGAFTSQTIAKDLNPQPEPPGSNRVFVFPGASFKLNPQPEPPGSNRTLIAPRSRLKLNPQPEPPGSFKIFRPRDWQGLNPQPEPP